jgi:hypothetical protein
MPQLYLPPAPKHLSPAQQQAWQRRQRMAETTLEIQTRSGSVADAETLAYFQRYVRGELTLEQAISRVRHQLAQEQKPSPHYLTCRNV